ncbi:MAG: hypothetical protein K2K96_07370 [Lachnospiraceae bacterium]|nr:hypothetical protein [Lachnospiraceae bacterium]
MDQNNMSPQENIGAQPTEQAQNPYMQPMQSQSAEQAPNPYLAPIQSQPAYQPPVESDDVSMGEWMWTMLLLYIPVVNFIMLIVWAFAGGTKASKANYCKAQLLWMLIFFCLSFVLTILAVFVGAGLFTSYIGSTL